MTLTQILNPYHTISIIGLAKNAGKTTTLNHIIQGFNSQNSRIALTSIGRDGENIDIATGTDKPRIFVRKNTVVITTHGLLSLCDITLEILAATNISTGGYYIVFCMPEFFSSCT